MNEALRRLLFLPLQSSTYAETVDRLHYFVIAVTMFGSTLVAAVAFYFIARYSRAANAPARTPRVEGALGLEVGLVGGLLGLFLLWFGLGFRLYNRMVVAPPDAMEVYVIAKQWMWEFDGPEGPAALETLYVPAGRPVKLLITSRDVIHSFFVPDFRLKQDAVPGRYTTAWFEVKAPGPHEVLCAEYCGTGHSIMRARVVALAPADYEAWRAGRREPEERGGAAALSRRVGGFEPLEVGAPRAGDLAERGRVVAAEHGCFRCHTVDGTPHIGPTWKNLYGSWERLSDGSRVLVDESYITESMMDPMTKIVAGYQPVMPSYRGEIDAPETAAIVELMKSLSRGSERRSTVQVYPR